MVCLTRSPHFEEGDSIAIEIETLQPKIYGQSYADLMVRYYINDRLVSEWESSVRPILALLPVEWLGKSISEKQEYARAEFQDNVSSNHEVLLEQYRVDNESFMEIQKEEGAEAFPYPFLYDVTILVNPDPEAIKFGGIGIRLGGFSYTAVYEFFSKLNDEVKAACA
jgi:hypothetical protein